MSGREEEGASVCAPPAPMLNSMRSAPGLALAARIACRKESRPSGGEVRSRGVVTTNVAGTTRSSSTSTDNRGRGCRRRDDAAVLLRGENREENHMIRLHRGGGLRYIGGAGLSARRPGAGAVQGR